MSISKFKTLRHIETVRNYINLMITELLNRSESHDQSKLQTPEVEIFEEFTPKLRDCTYGSDEYKQFLKDMKPAIDHHNLVNRHHPEHFGYWECNGCFRHFDQPTNMPNVCPTCGYSQFQWRSTGIQGMNLIDLLEMICDWKAATLRHNDGDILKSIDINQKRFGYSDELAEIFRNTVNWVNNEKVRNWAEES